MMWLQSTPHATAQAELQRKIARDTLPNGYQLSHSNEGFQLAPFAPGARRKQQHAKRPGQHQPRQQGVESNQHTACVINLRHARGRDHHQVATASHDHRWQRIHQSPHGKQRKHGQGAQHAHAQPVPRCAARQKWPHGCVNKSEQGPLPQEMHQRPTK